jgi:uncharacterized iron-regulated protein
MKQSYQKHASITFLAIFIIFSSFHLLQGCAMGPKKIMINGISQSFHEGMIISADTGNPISYTDLIAELSQVQIVYVGEKHTDPFHHEIQLRIIKDIRSLNQHTVVGMEMFDRSYQNVLNQWTNGKLDQKTFIKQTHWYANWKMDYALYGDILDFIKKNQLPLIGLNIPFHIPSKIATGGIHSLSNAEKKYLPKDIDTSNANHRNYVKKIFDLHHVKGMDDFEDFYAAQCAWDDAMAQAIAKNLGSKKMVAIIGNGHIIKKFGVPNRAYKRTNASFKTVYLAPPGSDIDRSFADYIWLTPSKQDKMRK